METLEGAAAVVAEGVSKSFEIAGQEQNVLNDCSHSFESGSVTLLLGPSGSGKTTLLTILAGFQRPSAGSVRLFGRAVEDYGRRGLQKLRAGRMTFVFQGFLLIDGMTVRRNILAPGRFAGLSHSGIEARLPEVLDELGLGGREDDRAGELSHGEKQRVVIARALLYRSPLIIADEPTASIDAGQGAFVMSRLRLLAGEHGSCVVVASHDARLAAFADTLLRIEDRRLV